MDKTEQPSMKLPEKIFLRLISALLFIYPWFLIGKDIGYDVLEFVSLINPLKFFIAFCGIFILLTILPIIIKEINTDAYALLFSSFTYACAIIFRKPDIYFSLGILALLLFCWYYLMKGDKLSLVNLTINDKATKIIVAVLAALFACFVGTLTVMKYYAYLTPGYDFGIFSQMFYYMKESFLPMVTCERDGLLSHFAVHISPIFYLLLPGYYIFPSPAYLQIAQAVILASGVIPIFLMAKKCALSNKAILCLSAAYLAFPALMGGCFYDLHENKFLTPLLLWLFYFIEKEKAVGIYIFSFLTLLVKEDSAIYVICIALFLIVYKKKYLHGIIIFIASVIYFIMCLFILNVHGDGAMTGRFDNFLSDYNLGIFGIIKTVILNPAYLISEVFTPEKFEFILLMLLPVAFIPLLSQKFGRLILLIPFLVINLMSDYKYQHSIDFQYTYGVIAILFYLTIINISEMEPKVRFRLLGLMTAASIMLCIAHLQPKVSIAQRFLITGNERQSISEALEEIPKDAAVASTPFFIPNLSQRDSIYVIDTIHDVDYAIIDLRPYTKHQNTEQYITDYKNKGFEQVEFVSEVILILKNQNYLH